MKPRVMNISLSSKSPKDCDALVRTLNLEEAASFLKIHPETLRQKVKAGEIPGAKIGKAYVFIESDLVDVIRSDYSSKWRAMQVTNKHEEVISWPCNAEQKKAHIGSISLSQVDKEYESLLGQKIEKKHRSTTMH